MSRMSGWTDKVRILNSDDSDVTSELGVIRGANHNVTKGGLESRSAVNYEGKPAYLKRGISEYNHSLVVHSDSFASLQLFGKTDGTSLVHSPSQPEFTFRQQATTDKYIELVSCKFGEVSIEISAPDEYLEFSFSGQGLGTNPENDLTSGVLDKLEYSGKPLQWSMIPVKWNDVVIGGLQSGTITLSRDLEPRGDVGAGSAEPQYLSEGPLSISVSGFSVDVLDDSAWQDVFSDSVGVLSVELPNGEVLKLTGFEWDEADPDEATGEEMVKSVSRSGSATDWEVENYGGTS